MKFLIVSGMSGAGKSKAASILEDFGFYCVGQYARGADSEFCGDLHGETRENTKKSPW